MPAPHRYFFSLLHKTKTTNTSDATVAANIKKYSTVWDSIMNEGRLDLFNTTSFSPNVVSHSKPTNIVGIDSASA